MSTPLKPLPAWADVALIPLVNVAAAFVISGFVVLAIGENPLEAVQSLVLGALGDLEGIGYTLFYATSFIFTGLSVAICFHAGLFNIGVEGQAYIAGLGAALVALHFGFLPGYTLAIAAIIGAALFGAAFAAIPGYLQAYRDSHIVITTIMFNYIASAIMGYLLVNVLRKPGQMNAESTPFRDTALVPQFHEVLAHFGITWPVTPFNLSFLLALVCCLAVWLLIWRTRLGYEIRTVGANPTAAVYGGISPARVTIITTLLSGALAGGVAANIILGDQHRLILEFVGGFGFVGIAVALMGRAHPVGIILAAILFGVLYQGGQALSIDMPKISRDMIVVIQGLVVLFAGALEHMFRRPVATLLARRTDSAAHLTGGGHGIVRRLHRRFRLRHAARRPAHSRLFCGPLVGALGRRRHRPRGQDLGRRVRLGRGCDLYRECMARTSGRRRGGRRLLAHSRLRFDRPARQPDRVRHSDQHGGRRADRAHRQRDLVAGGTYAATSRRRRNSARSLGRSPTKSALCRSSVRSISTSFRATTS